VQRLALNDAFRTIKDQQEEEGVNYAVEEVEEVEEESSSSVLIQNLDKGNIVDQIPDNAKSYEDVMRHYDIADRSMVAWLKKYNRAIKLAKLQPTSGDQDIEVQTFPFKGASMAMLPYILEAMLDFSSRSAPELVWTDKIVAGKVTGKEHKAPDDMNKEQQGRFDKGLKDTKQARADRVALFSNYQLSNDIPRWKDGQDKLLMMLPCVGTAYKKTYRDYEADGICSELIRADKLKFDMDCDSFEESIHKFQDITVSRNDLISYIRGDQKWALDEKDLEEDKDSFDFIEAYTTIDIDEDGLAEPYIAILDRESEEIICLYPNYDDDTIIFNDDEEVVRITETPCFTQYRFLPDPEGGPMGMGWGILLGPMFSAINKSFRQLLDSGTLANTAANSGLITAGIGKKRGNRQEAGPVDVTLGQLTPVSMGGISSSLRENIVQLPFAGPNPTLFALLQYMIESARSMTNAATNVEANQGEAASLYLARLQQGLKVPNSIIMRVHEAAKNEMQKIHALNYKYHDSEKYNRVLDEEIEYVMEDDFNTDDCDIQLVSDPSKGSDVERAARAEANLQLAMTLAQSGQQIINTRQAVIDFMEANKTQNIDELVPEPQEGPSQDMQLMMAEKQMEAELKERDQKLRENGQRLQEQKLAMESAKEMTRLGLEGDKLESDITKKYMESLKIAYEIGMNGIPYVQQVERTFIDAEGGTTNAIPPSNPNPSGALAPRPSNEGPIQLP